MRIANAGADVEVVVVEHHSALNPLAIGRLIVPAASKQPLLVPFVEESVGDHRTHRSRYFDRFKSRAAEESGIFTQVVGKLLQINSPVGRQSPDESPFGIFDWQ